MKTITLKTVQLARDGEEVPYAALIRQCVSASKPNAPVMLDEQRKRIRVLDALDALKPGAKALELEDEDAKTLARCVEEMPWAFTSKGIVQFADDVLAGCKG